MQRTAVVVTGASTGIGAAASEALAQHGFAVFAGVRNVEDAARIGAAHERISPLLLDVTDPKSIEEAALTVAESDIPLHGVVNNAGIAVGGPIEHIPIETLRRQFEVNVFGAIAVTQAFLPRMHAGSRVVFVGSTSGRLPMPYIAPYSASKFALRAFSDALRIELAPAKIRVSLVEPGSVKTPIWSKGRASKGAMMASLPPNAREHYGQAIDALMRQTELEERSGMPVERVSEAILDAITSPKPRAHYVVGAPAKMGRILSLLPASLYDRIFRASMKLP